MFPTNASVRPYTRGREEAAIQELGCRPNLAVRSLAAGTSCSIGIIYRAQGYQLFVEALADAEKNQSLRELSERLNRSGFDGVILVLPLSERDKVIAMLARIGVPCVLIAPAKASPFERSVAIDDVAAARSMTEHIIGYGDRHIVFIRGPAGQVSAESLWEGFQAAMRDAKLPVYKGWIAKGDYTYRSGMPAAEKILSAREQRPTVIFASRLPKWPRGRSQCWQTRFRPRAAGEETAYRVLLDFQIIQRGSLRRISPDV